MAGPVSSTLVIIGKKLIFEFLSDSDKILKTLLFIICVMILVIALPVISIVSLFPASEPDFVDHYKDIEKIAGINWVDMIALDTVRYDNNFEDLTTSDVRDTGIDFLIINLFKYRWYPDPEDEDGGDWVLVSDFPIEYNTRTEIESLLSDFNMSFDDNFEDVYNDINSIHGKTQREYNIRTREYIKYKYEISISYKELESLSKNLEFEKKEWLDTILADNIIPQIYLEDFELPEHIEVIASGMFASPSPTVTNITSHFGYRTHPITGEYKLHAGTDFADANCLGEPVIAVADGEVIQTFYSNTGGKIVKIKHIDSEGNTWHSRYLHLNQIEVTVGDNVNQGDVIGAIGNTGRSTGPHLHFELYYEGAVVNPIDYLKLSQD